MVIYCDIAQARTVLRIDRSRAAVYIASPAPRIHHAGIAAGGVIHGNASATTATVARAAIGRDRVRAIQLTRCYPHRSTRTTAAFTTGIAAIGADDSIYSQKPSNNQPDRPAASHSHCRSV